MSQGTVIVITGIDLLVDGDVMPLIRMASTQP